MTGSSCVEQFKGLRNHWKLFRSSIICTISLACINWLLKLLVQHRQGWHRLSISKSYIMYLCFIGNFFYNVPWIKTVMLTATKATCIFVNYKPKFISYITNAVKIHIGRICKITLTSRNIIQYIYGYAYIFTQPTSND